MRRTPKLCHHRPSGRAYVTDPATRKEVYLGRWGTPEAEQAYARWLADYAARALHSDVQERGVPARPTVDVLLCRYLEFAEGYYLKRGQITSEVRNLHVLIRHVRAQHGATLVEEFGPPQWKVVRQAMVSAGMVRETINSQQGRLLRIWRWGVEEGLVSPEALTRLEAVRTLKKGRSAAPDRPEVAPVSLSDVQDTVPHLPEWMRQVVWLMWWSGVRIGEALSVRRSDVDTSRTPWRLTVVAEWNKVAHRDDRGSGADIVYLGPQARAVLQPLLSAAARDAYLWPGRRGRRRNPSHFRHRLQAACEAAGVSPWHAHQIRHATATRIRARHGLEGVQAQLRHEQRATSERYAEPDDELARRVAEEMG